MLWEQEAVQKIKRTVKEICEDWGLPVIPVFVNGRLRRTYAWFKIREKIIEIGRKTLKDFNEKEVDLIIKHEVCHYIEWEMYGKERWRKFGVRDAHGYRFQEICKVVGTYSPSRISHENLACFSKRKEK